MDDKQQKHVQLQRCAKDVWDVQMGIHRKDSRTRLVSMLCRLYKYKAKAEEGIDETAAKLEDMRDIIASINPEVRRPDIMITLELIDSIDDEQYNAVQLQLNDLENLTLRKVVDKCEEVEQMARDNAGTPYEATNTQSLLKVSGKSVVQNSFSLLTRSFAQKHRGRAPVVLLHKHLSAYPR